jgi:hypothetical protein
MLQPLPSQQLPVDAKYHTAVACRLRVQRIGDIPLKGVALTVVDIGSEFAKEEWEMHGSGVVVACEAAALLGKSSIQLLGQHSGMMFDKHLVGEALHGAGCEVVDIALGIPSLMQVVDGREDRRRETIKTMDAAEAFT